MHYIEFINICKVRRASKVGKKELLEKLDQFHNAMCIWEKEVVKKVNSHTSEVVRREGDRIIDTLTKQSSALNEVRKLDNMCKSNKSTFNGKIERCMVNFTGRESWLPARLEESFREERTVVILGDAGIGAWA
jgi:hypothetical protein